MELTVLEICAGAGGQSSGLERAGFRHVCLVEHDRDAAATLRLNRPEWDVAEQDVRLFDASSFQGVSLLAGGVPCQPFSAAGLRLGADDERDLFPAALDMVDTVRPDAVMFENVKELATTRFAAYREAVLDRLGQMGYVARWRLLRADEHGVPQSRTRLVIVALRPQSAARFRWPEPLDAPAPTVGETLRALMGERGWSGADAWADRADRVAPTIVGGSKKHGGADLGPTSTRKTWLAFGVDGRSVADEAPGPDVPADGLVRLTCPMAARLQGFDPGWRFVGRKTSVYRQIGNAFPPPVAERVGRAILDALSGEAPPPRTEKK